MLNRISEQLLNELAEIHGNRIIDSLREAYARIDSLEQVALQAQSASIEIGGKYDKMQSEWNENYCYVQELEQVAEAACLLIGPDNIGKTVDISIDWEGAISAIMNASALSKLRNALAGLKAGDKRGTRE